MKYKALLIDIDDTLLNFRYGEKYAVKPVFEYYNIPYTDEMVELYSSINVSYWKKHELQQVSHQDVLDQRWIDFFKHFNKEINPDEVNERYYKSLANVAILMPNALEFMERASKIMDIYFVTNGEPYAQYPRLKISGLDKYAKKAFISDEMGVAKPAKVFYDIVLAEIGLNRDECIVVGDSLTSDIKGAINSGIDYVWYNPNNLKNLDNHQSITDLLEFFDLVEKAL